MYGIYYFVPSVWTIVLLLSIVVLFSRTSKLLNKIKYLEDSITLLESSRNDRPSQPTYVNQNNAVLGEMPVHLSAVELSRPAVAPVLNVRKVEEIDDPLSKWFKENLLLKLGVLMILVGFGWFVSYAFMHNWIGPVGRITIGIIAGTLITLFGTFRLGKNQVQGNAFTILGTALIIITILAGQYYYSFFTPTLVLALVFLVSLYVSMTAVASSQEKLAVYGMVVSIIAPLLSHTAGMNHVLLYLYLGVTSVAAIWISVLKNWKSTPLLGITGIFMYSISNFFGGSLSHDSLKYLILIITYSISLLYLLVGVSSMVRNQSHDNSKDIYITIINSLLILGFTTSIVPTVYQSLIIAGWMIVYAISGFFVFEKTRNQQLFYVHSCISILFLALATSIELSGPTLVIAFIVEAAIIVVSSFIITNNIKTAQTAAFILAVPGFMSLQSLYANSWNHGIMHSDFVVLFLSSIVLGLLGIFFKQNQGQASGADELKIHNIMFILSTVYIYALVWLCSHSILKNSDSAVFVSLFIYTVAGLTTHFYGLFTHNNSLRRYGMSLLILVVVRLVLVDVWNMELILRVITFIVLGAMFMSTAFISRNQNTNSLIK